MHAQFSFNSTHARISNKNDTIHLWCMLSLAHYQMLKSHKTNTIALFITHTSSFPSYLRVYTPILFSGSSKSHTAPISPLIHIYKFLLRSLSQFYTFFLAVAARLRKTIPIKRWWWFFDEHTQEERSDAKAKSVAFCRAFVKLRYLIQCVSVTSILTTPNHY